MPKLALDGIAFSIKAGEKIGICGRTGRYGIYATDLFDHD
jgi:ABC-type transport system involved in cytochrome bd biosynthesis fused ATPase/permease subunit